MAVAAVTGGAALAGSTMVPGTRTTHASVDTTCSPRVLKTTTSAGFTSYFQFGPGISVSALPVGARITVSYKTTNQGTMVAQSVTLDGEKTATGVVQSIAADGSRFTITTTHGRSVSFPAPAHSALAQALADGRVAEGDTVSVAYITKPSLTVISVAVTAVPTTTTTTTTTTPTTTTPTTTTPTTTTPTTTTTSTTPTGGTGWRGGVGRRGVYRGL